jgi:hypothetical protein
MLPACRGPIRPAFLENMGRSGAQRTKQQAGSLFYNGLRTIELSFQWSYAAHINKRFSALTLALALQLIPKNLA